MGKQINYYMEYESFLKIAELALKEGCLILKRKHFSQPQAPSSDIAVIDEETENYYFYIPELADLKFEQDVYGNYYVYDFDELSLALIEASYSKVDNNKQEISSARLYIRTGYYTDSIWVARSERITKVYEKLARAVKKIAQYTNVEFSYPEIIAGKMEPRKSVMKIYTTAKCLEWRTQGAEFECFTYYRERLKSNSNNNIFVAAIIGNKSSK